MAMVLLWSTMMAATPAVRWSMRWLRMGSENRCTGVDISVGLCSRMLIFVNDCEDRSWGLRRVVDLQEGVRMLSSFLTGGAVVKILADTALESWSGDWGHTTTVTFDVHVLDLTCLGSA